MTRPNDSGQAVELERERFIEAFAVAAGAFGWPKIAGKMFAWLLICEPPEQTPEEIEKALAVSRGSVSAMARFLLERGFIERSSRRGERKMILRISRDVWDKLLRRQLASVEPFHRMAEEAVKVVGNAKPSTQARAQEMAMFYRWWSSELPALMDRWEAYRQEVQ